VIFACSSGLTSKSAQPPIEYLNQISKINPSSKHKIKPLVKGSKGVAKSISLSKEKSNTDNNSTKKRDDDSIEKLISFKDTKRIKKGDKLHCEQSNEWVTVVSSRQKKRDTFPKTESQKGSVNRTVPINNISPHSEDDSSVEAILEKDTRYSKKNIKCRESEKKLTPIGTDNVVAKSKDEFVKVETKKRKNMRRET